MGFQPAPYTTKTMEPSSQYGSLERRSVPTASTQNGTSNDSSSHGDTNRRPDRCERTHWQRLGDQCVFPGSKRYASPGTIPTRCHACHTAPKFAFFCPLVAFCQRYSYHITHHQIACVIICCASRQAYPTPLRSAIEKRHSLCY